MWILLFLACSSTPSNPCTNDAQMLVEADDGALSCADAKIPTRYLRILAGRPLPAGTTAVGVNRVKERFLADAPATRAWLDELQAAGRAIETTRGLGGAELRANGVYETIGGDGLIPRDDPALWNLVEPALSVYAKDDTQKLALTEIDMETWISYASFCHEVQGSGVLSVSIAQRSDVYRMLKDRFEQAGREEMVAMAAFGPTWEDIRDRWQAASYDEQQAWIREAPRPDPLDASSLGFIETVIEGDLVGHARVLHKHLGPLHFRDGEGYFAGAN